MCRQGADSTVQDLHEGLAELDVEGGVDDGVHGTVDIAQPREGAVEDWRDVAVTVYVQDVRDEEGQPADDEYTWGEGRVRLAPRPRRGYPEWALLPVRLSALPPASLGALGQLTACSSHRITAKGAPASDLSILLLTPICRKWSPHLPWP